MNSSYEDIRHKTIEENQKNMQALNLTKLSQCLYTASSSSSKPSSSVKGRLRFVQPRELEVNKKLLRSTTTQKLSIASLPIQTIITPTPIQTTITPTPIQTTIVPPPIQTTIKDVVVEYETENVVVGDDTENVVVGDETEDVVVEDGA
ncbi:hypothetical protein KIW84_044739 [Lathyrus oleraceus]|uniref:Uncharacterized protein n=1 Tax=Pisum sativum TaxID=3888 RepID=A0A9D5AQS5_PEA|nr:hypothetical protein KIW84_044739 [Pisum sativum]